MGQQGFTLIEQIVTVAIMAMVLTAWVAALSTGALGLNVTASRNQAMNLAQKQMECIKSADFQPSYSTDCPGDLDVTDDLGYRVETTAEGVVPDPARPDPADWDPCGSCTVQLITVNISRGTKPLLEIADLKVDRP